MKGNPNPLQYTYKGVDMDYLGFVYLWMNNVTGKMYIGSHIGKVDDGYIGSGVYFKRAIKKHGIDSFTRQILYFEHKDHRSLYQKEFDIINEYNAVMSDDYYNLCNISPNYINFVDGKLVKRVSDETKQKMSDIAKGRYYTDETKQKMSDASYIKGKNWYNDGSISKVFDIDDIPDGWVKGRISTGDTTKGYKFYTNGDNNISLMVGDIIPDGYTSGKNNNDTFKGTRNPFHGKKHTDETKARLRGPRPSVTGSKNPAAVSIEVDGVRYETIKEAMISTGYSYAKVKRIGNVT